MRSPAHPSNSITSNSSAVLPSYQQTTNDVDDDDDVEENNSNDNADVEVNCYRSNNDHNKSHAHFFERLYRALSLDQRSSQYKINNSTERQEDDSSSSSLSPELQRLSPKTNENVGDDNDQQYRYIRNRNQLFLSLIMRGCIAVSVVLAVTVAAFMISAHSYHHKHESIPAAATSTTPTTCPDNNNNNNSNDDSWNAAFAQKASLQGLKNAAVAADHPLCSQMGLDIIQKSGGNAVDAAVTVALCLGVANPASSGMGGGAFMLVHASREHFLQKQVDNNGNLNVEMIMPAFRDARSVEDQEIERQEQQEEALGGQSSSSRSSNNKKGRRMMTEVVDCREVAPAAATEDMYLHHATQDSEHGGLAIGVPGELRGLELAHYRHGKLSWRQVVEPVAALAQRGVVINANLANEIGFMQKRYTGNTTSTATSLPEFFHPLRQILTHNNDWNTPLQQGELLKNPALAKTLRRIQTHGANAIYTGEPASQWAADIQNVGGIVTAHDLESYQATLRSPVVGRGHLQGLTVVGVPPPSSGGAAIIGATRFLASFQNSANSPPLSRRTTTLSQHRMVEATKHAFSIRMSLADPDYNTETVQDAVNDLVHSDYMQTLQRTEHNDSSTLPLSHYGGTKWAQLKDTDGQAPIVPDAKEGDRRRQRRRLSDQNVDNDIDKNEPSMGGRPFGYLNDGGTSHFSILDQDGNAVSMTTSVNTYFGSNVLSPSTGILLSNTMDDFSSPGRPNYFGLQPSTANYIHANKKPLSSMSPTLVFAKEEEEDNGADDNDNDWGDLVLVLGASGGPKIISAVFRVLVNHLFLGMGLWQAIIDPRLHDQLIYHGAAVTTFEKSTVDVDDSDDDDGNGIIQSTTTTLAQNITVGDRILQALQKRGHGLLEVDYEGTVQAISVDMETKELTVVCDPRKGGSPAGY